MRDSRVFHIDDNYWIKKYNGQVMFEVQKFNAWTEGGPELVIEEAQQRLRKEGWDSLRPALAVTIRSVYYISVLCSCIPSICSPLYPQGLDYARLPGGWSTRSIWGES